jgi:hypothetical protein
MTVMSARLEHESWSIEDKTDAEMFVRGSEFVCGVRLVLIVDEAGVDWWCRVVELREVDEDASPLLYTETVCGSG